MSYKKGAEVLPAHLLQEVQKYIDGGLVYIPKRSKKVGWGCLSGIRKSIDKRNDRILRLYTEGYSIEYLAQKYFLSQESIKKIIYGRKQL